MFGEIDVVFVLGEADNLAVTVTSDLWPGSWCSPHSPHTFIIHRTWRHMNKIKSVAVSE